MGGKGRWHIKKFKALGKDPENSLNSWRRERKKYQICELWKSDVEIIKFLWAENIFPHTRCLTSVIT
jgi:hypothetical protein